MNDSAYTDVLYEKRDGVAWVTINRPEVRNAFRTRTVAELTDAFSDARLAQATHGARRPRGPRYQ